MLNWISAHDGQSCEKCVYVCSSKALHVNLCQIGIKIASQVVIVTQVIFSIGGRE